MARGLLFLWVIMQIPYDLEFVENRPTVRARALALHEPFPSWQIQRQRGQRDGFDTLLAWIHRMLQRFEKN